jgi:PAS domain S-box-containing protein
MAMIIRMLRQISLGRRIFYAFIFLVGLFAVTVPYALNDNLLLLDRLRQVTNFDKTADMFLLESSKRVESSRLNLMRFLWDFIPTHQESMDDVSHAVEFLEKANSLLSMNEQKTALQRVMGALSDYQSMIKEIGDHPSDGKDIKTSRLVFAALNTGSNIAFEIEAIVEANQTLVLEKNSEVEDHFKSNMLFLMTYYAVTLILSLIVAPLMGRSITKPVAALREGAELFRQGDMDFRVAVTGKDELSHLAATFNEMVSEIHQNRASLQERARALEKELGERKRAEEELQRYQTKLEELVEHRTRELNEAVQQLTREVDQRKQAEEELNQTLHRFVASERKASAMSQAANDAIVMIDNQGKVRFWNHSAEKLFGYTAIEVEGADFHDIAAPAEVREKAAMGIKHFAESGQGPVFGATIQTTAIDRTGKTFPVEVSLSHFQIDDEWYAVGTVRDITERKKAEEDIRESEERIRTILDAVNAGIIVIDPKNRMMVDANPAAERLIGLPRKKIIGNLCHKFICPSEIDECPVIDGHLAIDNAERFLLNAQGQEIPILKTVVKVKLGGKPHLVESFVDLTEQKQAEAEIRRNLEELERFTKLTIGREEKMIELKTEVNHLMHQLGLTDKYLIVQ